MAPIDPKLIDELAQPGVSTKTVLLDSMTHAIVKAFAKRRQLSFRVAIHLLIHKGLLIIEGWQEAEK